MNQLNVEIQDMVRGHGHWKQQLRLAVARMPEAISVELVRREDTGPMGKWLAEVGQDPARSHGPHFDKVRLLHRDFLIEAAKIAQLARTGDVEDALEGFEEGSAMQRSSDALLAEMTKWWLYTIRPSSARKSAAIRPGAPTKPRD
ncbi:hypothetical protein [Chachezhania sediminis]|uniref:hypothetical protein n=1 Tax=Chachezhania sediminis TaxID=2599291 RepID=UPI00131C3A44|nr:hypothetical protein [Chachezhania sediminis]